MNSALFFVLFLQQGILFRSDKIFTVLLVILIIWFGILLYLFRIGKRLQRLEKRGAEEKEL